MTSGEDGEDCSAEVERLPEDVGDAERLEPERLDVVREGGDAGQQQQAGNRHEEETGAPLRLRRRAPVYGVGHFNKL